MTVGRRRGATILHAVVTVLSIALGVLMVAYTVAGCALAFNVWGISDRLAGHYARKPWLLRRFGRDDPRSWRVGGLMVFIGIPTLMGWMIIEAVRPFPVLNKSLAAWILIGIAILASVGWVAMRRRRGAGSAETRGS